MDFENPEFRLKQRLLRQHTNQLGRKWTLYERLFQQQKMIDLLGSIYDTVGVKKQ